MHPRAGFSALKYAKEWIVIVVATRWGKPTDNYLNSMVYQLDYEETVAREAAFP